MKNGSFDFDEFPVGCTAAAAILRSACAYFNFHPDITHGRERGRLGLPRDHFD